MLVSDKSEFYGLRCLQLQQNCPSVGNRGPILRSLRKNSYKTQLRDGTGQELRLGLCCQVSHPARHPRVKFVFVESERHQGVDVEQISHGKVDRISSTSLLVRIGAFGPAVSTGKPVMGSLMMRTFLERFLRGVRTIRPPSTLASSGSPGRSPSLLRMRLGRTTWPFVESLVSMVRQSYPVVPAEATRLFLSRCIVVPQGKLPR